MEDQKRTWKSSKDVIQSYRCIQHSITKEVSLVGRHGEIWNYSERTYSAVVTNHRLANKLCRKLGRRASYRKGDEALFSNFGEDMLTFMIEAIQPFKYQKWQIEKASNFGKPIRSNISPPQEKCTAVSGLKIAQMTTIEGEVPKVGLERSSGHISGTSSKEAV